MKCLIHTVMDVLASNSWCLDCCPLHVADLAMALELSGLCLKSLLDMVWIAVMVLTVLNTGHVMGVLLGKDFLMLDGLDGSMVVVLVDLSVNDLLGLLLLGTMNPLMFNGRVYALMDGSVVLSISGEEV